MAAGPGRIAFGLLVTGTALSPRVVIAQHVNSTLAPLPDSTLQYAVAICASLLACVAWHCTRAVRRRQHELATLGRAIMLFDGDCVLCNGYVDFCLSRRPKVVLKVATLNSELGVWLCKQHGVPLPPSSFVFIEEFTSMPQVKLHRRVSQRSDAALRSLSALSPTWLWLLMMLFEPAPLIVRDAVYDLGWKYRRAIFGTTTCRKRSEHDLSPNDVKGFGMSR